jgi:uncharacterized protein YxeA
MKKILSLMVLIFLVLILGSLLIKKGVIRTGGMKTTQLSADDSLETIEQELEKTTLQEFESELDALDEKINQL